MKPLLFSLFLVFFASIAMCQTTIDLIDDTEIQSGANIIINPGDYDIQDVTDNGILRIVNKNNVVIDGTDVHVSGMDTTGYLIYLENSTNVTIRNFGSAGAFYYAVRAKYCSGLTIEDNTFSYNQKDTLGWIFIWTDVEDALGGGVLLDQCGDSEIMGNTMTQQNDGVAMYHCDSIHIHDNTLNWNCGFGIRMNFTDKCNIHDNDCSHVNRITDPSDCAAILLIVSNENRVENNNLTYSGDGVFLGQYGYHQIPNNNYFAHNDCSYSPHNAIEATFGDGNIFVDNKCNFSHYGLWLGYSFNNLVEGNEVIGNLTAGIAIDRGFENTFRENIIRQNPYGFQLWEGGVIGPYGDQFSHDYYIYDNDIQGNMWGIHAINTEHLVASGNDFIHNQKADIYLEGESFSDTITRNFFNAPTDYFIQAMTEDAIEAPDNQFNPADRGMIIRKMRGTINWYPFVEGPAPR
ncbi:MAG: right-handed parallel beta-helix repeat-containing protein, partial [Bacteroidales bacterium]|nr:right-handed parallel beta-helix repeat-containing protein [Bacteroidales bacterium]